MKKDMELIKTPFTRNLMKIKYPAQTPNVKLGTVSVNLKNKTSRY